MSEDKLRRAVGAIIFHKDEYLLVHKVKDVSAKVELDGQWDFVKGGLQKSDKDLHMAILRELEEETGSNNYKIIKKYDEKICFDFPEYHKYKCQETVMFLIEYLGDRTDLRPQDEEIDEIKFYSKENVEKLLTLKETRKFMMKVSW